MCIYKYISYKYIVLIYSVNVSTFPSITVLVK